jgi:anaerobic selenocysteine-containing dehydrogenase
MPEISSTDRTSPEKPWGLRVWKRSLDCQDWPDLIRESGLSRQAMEELAALLGQPRPKPLSASASACPATAGVAWQCGRSPPLLRPSGFLPVARGAVSFFRPGPFAAIKPNSPGHLLPRNKPGSINMIHLGHALTALEPPVHALFVYNANPASVNPDGALVRRGLAREDLFTVVHEQVMTPTARYADLLLPATTFLENRDIYSAYGHFYLGVTEPVIDPVGEARSNFDLFQGLARKMGFTDRAFFQSCDQRIADYLDGMPGLPDDFDLSADPGRQVGALEQQLR